METLGMLAGANGKRRLHDTSQFDRHVLSNGIVVWLQKPVIQTDYRGFLSVFFSNVGHHNDPCDAKGLAHFLEHMIFRGSKNNRSKEELIGPISRNSGLINASTSKRHTQYQVQIHQDKLEIAAETLFEMVSSPLLAPQDIEIERNVILREIQEHRITGNDLTTEHVKRILCGKNHPMLFPGRGYPSHVEKISEEDLRSFFAANYHAGNANIICGGSFSFRGDALLILERIFGKMTVGPSNSENIIPCNPAGGVFTLKDRRYETNSLNIGYFFPKLAREKMRPLEFLVDSVGSGFSSPLLHELREKRGLIYNMSFDTKNSDEAAIATFFCGLRPGKFEEAQQIFLEVLSRINEDFLISRMYEQQNKRGNFFNLPVVVCDDAVDEIMTHGRTYSYEEWEKMEDDILLEDVMSWRDKLLSLEPLVIHFLIK